MATPEELQAALTKYENPHGESELRKRVGALEGVPGRVAMACVELLRCSWDAEHRPRWESERRSIEQLSEADRERVFEALFPPIAGVVEAAWQLQKRLPYQSGYLRKGFRAPKQADLTLDRRLDWLTGLLRTLPTYHYDLTFLPQWGAYLGYGVEHEVGLLLAAALEGDIPEAEQTYGTLVQIVQGEHAFAVPARYAVTALLASSRPEAWATVERLLLAAQRQEGLRQVVLESIDFAARDAFVRMLKLIAREELSRFAAVARAAAVWFGLLMDSGETKAIDGLIQATIVNLTEPEARARRLREARGEDLYLALWAEAFEDVEVATEIASRLIADADFERRYAAVHLLAQLKTTAATEVIIRYLRDADLRIAIKAVEVLPTYSPWRKELAADGEMFRGLQHLTERTPVDEVLAPAVWPWNRLRAKQSEVAAKLIAQRGEHPLAEMVPYIPAMDSNGRRLLLESVRVDASKRGCLQADERALALSLLSDGSPTVRQIAFELLEQATLTSDEAKIIEPLLRRKVADVRRAVMELLLKQSEEGCRATVARLANARDLLMTQAAEEIERELKPKSEPIITQADGLGLFDPAQRTAPAAPRNVLGSTLRTSLSDRLLAELDRLVKEHRETPVEGFGVNGVGTNELFGNLRWVDPDGRMPLQNVWREWWAAASKEAGELELVRAMCTAILLCGPMDRPWVLRVAQDLGIEVALEFPHFVRSILVFLVAEYAGTGGMHLLIDVMETYLERVTQQYDPAMEVRTYEGARSHRIEWLTRAANLRRRKRPDIWDRELWRRYWPLQRWIDEGMPGTDRQHPLLETTLAAHQAGVASEADVYEHLLGGRDGTGVGYFALAVVTRRKTNHLLQAYPDVARFASRCRERILEIELKRGELPTAASEPARRLAAVFGAELALKLLVGLGRDPFARGYDGGGLSRAGVFSHLLRVCLPAEDDTPERFAAAAKRWKVPEKRLVGLALYAPQWAAYVEQATGIAGLEEATNWLHAHTKDSQWLVPPEISELWFAEASARTPLSRQELLEGAVDVEWFQRARGGMTDRQWKLVWDAAKYAAGGAGHKRAQLFANAISGEINNEELAALVREKRRPDAVRALGLVPLARESARRGQEVLRRYELLQEFRAGSAQFGAQRQASEKLAYTMGLANLARTAGYRDGQRLAWAMEAAAIADLKQGPVVVTEGVVTVRLAVNAAGEAELTFEKNGKVLKELPAALKKSPGLVALRARRTALAQQAAPMRESLEEAMIRGDRLARAELKEMAEHPLLGPMLAMLLYAGEDGQVRWYRNLLDQQGAVRIAHPVDLLESGEWAARQQECLQAGKVQPFKQAFRELYLLTQAERETGSYSGRYEGQQVNPAQAVALLGKRGWVNVPEEGIRKTFHHEQVSVWVTFLQGWFTPSEIDGLTVHEVFFTHKPSGERMRLEQVHPRLFSEAMRDLDLMVSVAHRGGVDPEATASTVEMRMALLRETLALLKLSNVRLKGQHAFVEGQRGSYNVHLGSGTVHRQPGGNLCIVPVHSQHRGRLFLPFAGPDPKTAEIVSKVLLLAQDNQIKDPTILEQLR